MLDDGVIYRRWQTADGSRMRLQLVVPISMHKELMEMTHACMGGHVGIQKSIQALQKRAYLTGLTRDTERFCKRCLKCAKFKKGKLKPQAQLRPAGEGFERVSLDLIGCLPRSSGGHTFALTAMCLFTKWAEVYPLRDITAETVARTFVDGWVSRFGSPIQVITDQGSQYESELFSELCKRLGIDKVRTSGYHPQCQGGIERFHRTLNGLTARAVAVNQRN
jgi:hypothetical protein